MQQDWNLADYWNAAAVKEDRPPQKRDYVYASELMYPKIDRFLKMKGEPYSNPPNDRSRRKFLAGNIWELIVRDIFVICGIYHKAEVKADLEPYSDVLPVHGRLDFIAGGTINKDEALQRLYQKNFDEVLEKIGEKVIISLDGQVLAEKIMEIKSVSMFAFDVIEKRRKPMLTHAAQGYHYKKAKGIPADVAYISKDTCLLAQYSVGELETEYRNDLVEMTHYFTKGIQPPPDALLGFDNDLAKFNKNLGVEYSPYLSVIYGFENPDAYRRKVEPIVKRWNNGLTRYAKCELGHLTPSGKPMTVTAKNKEIRAEIMSQGFDFNELLTLKMKNVGNEDEEEDI